MGQKVDPRGLRIGIIKTWDSNWFAQGKDYLSNFHEDLKIKEYIKKNYYHAGISKVLVERVSNDEVTVIVETAKAGILIGRKGQEIETLKFKLEKLTGKKVNAKALEIKNPNKVAQLVAESIATSIEKRVAYKRAVQQAIQRAEKAGIKRVSKDKAHRTGKPSETKKDKKSAGVSQKEDGKTVGKVKPEKKNDTDISLAERAKQSLDVKEGVKTVKISEDEDDEILNALNHFFNSKKEEEKKRGKRKNG